MKSFGSDPEFLLTQNNKSKSAIEIIKADFENPIKFNGCCTFIWRGETIIFRF